MRISARTSLLILTVLVPTTSASAVDLPDFTGHWKVITSKTKGPPTFGAEFDAKQNAKSLSITLSAGGRVESVTYSLEGAETKHVLVPGIESVSITSWTGNELVIVTRIPPPHDSEITRRMSLNSKHELSIQTSVLPNPDVITTVYARK